MNNSTNNSAANTAVQSDVTESELLKSKIMIVDDDEDTLDLVEAFFKPKGFEVLKYMDAEKALTDLVDRKLECDVVITDLMLPKLSGLDFTRELVKKECDIPIILITANKSVENAIEAINAGAYDFVVKPLHFPQLLVSVQRALHFSRIKRDNTVLKTAIQIKEGIPLPGIIGKSPGFLKALDLAKRVAVTNSNVFISGESGTGKEVIAKAIHQMGDRKNEPFIAINCSSIPETLLESELFGHSKGAFTGAADKKIGLFEEANGGTLFLDEIGDLSLPLQAKLLRVLQERKIKRIGENQFRNIDVRIISATHKDLRKEVHEKSFREDLFFRLNVIQIRIPPLRERKEDIVPLAEFFMKKFSATNNVGQKQFSKEVLERFLSHPWPGNVRELENMVERAVVLSSGELIMADDLPDDSSYNASETGDSMEQVFMSSTSDAVMTVDQVVKRYIQMILNKNNGAREKTARELDIDRKTLYRKIQEMQSAQSQETAK
jgi:two-component system response regulator HydG